jgi:hypothetical protein
MPEQTVAAGIEQAVKAYIQACNDGDAETIAACFCSDAVHYFPTGPKWAGASTIGANFSRRVRELGHFWTVDKVLVDADRRAAALEWTQFAKNGRVLRGGRLVLVRGGIVPYSGDSRLRRRANPTRPRAPGFAGFRLRGTWLSDDAPDLAP